MHWPTSVVASRRRKLDQEAAFEALINSKLIEPGGPRLGQFLVSGHIDEGLSAFGTILDRVGKSLPRTPRRALLRLLFSRARLRLRGLGFRERKAAAVPGEKLELIDIFRSVAVGISIVDVIRGADYQTRSLLLALEAGEPLRIALALGWEAVHVACQGRPAWRRTERLVAAADKLAGRLGHPHALGMAGLSSGAAEFLIGRYHSGLEVLNRAEAIFSERCTGVIWELDTTRIFCLWSLFYLGRVAELGIRCHDIFQEARERGDRYMVATPGPFVGTFVQPGGGRRREPLARAPSSLWETGRIKAFTSSISISIMGVCILSYTPAMRRPPGTGSRKPSRFCSLRSCCESSRFRPT